MTRIIFKTSSTSGTRRGGKKGSRRAATGRAAALSIAAARVAAPAPCAAKGGRCRGRRLAWRALGIRSRPRATERRVESVGSGAHGGGARRICGDESAVIISERTYARRRSSGPACATRQRLVERMVACARGDARQVSGWYISAVHALRSPTTIAPSASPTTTIATPAQRCTHTRRPHSERSDASPGRARGGAFGRPAAHPHRPGLRRRNERKRSSVASAVAAARASGARRRGDEVPHPWVGWGRMRLCASCDISAIAQ